MLSLIVAVILAAPTRATILETLQAQAPPPAVPPAAGKPAVEPIPSVVAELAKLQGQVSFRLARLGERPRVLYELNPDTQLAIGSAFKLYILAALSEGPADWNVPLRVDEAYRSFGTGCQDAMDGWPAGTEASVEIFAIHMISCSDNTATDHLLHHVGRPRVEAMLGRLGNAHPDRTIPFLSTLEMFKLKSAAGLLTRYVTSDEAGRRALLDGEIKAMTREQTLAAIERDGWGAPIAIDKVEWFASAADLVRVMDSFNRKNDAKTLGILAINPGLRIDKDKFSYAGFKGGSEPGVLDLTFLLKKRDGTAYALSAAWNNPAKDVDLKAFVQLVQKIIDSLGAQ